MQKTDEGHLLPIMFVSRCLSETEKKYSVIEGEALAVIWCMERFAAWIGGGEVVLMTDHQPLTYIFQNPNNQPKLVRWALKLQ